MTRTDILAGALIAAIATTVVLLPPFARLDGLSIDWLFALRDRAFGPRHLPAESRVVVVALDEETYRRDPFRVIPHEMWTPQLATVLTAVSAAGPKAIGLDIIQTTSVEPFLPGFDKAYRLALYHAAVRAGSCWRRSSTRASRSHPIPA